MSIVPKVFQRGAALDHKSITRIEASQLLRPLRDTLILEPLDACLSAIIHVVHEIKPIRGIVRAVGPGTYPKRYDHADKHKRTRMWDSTRFQSTQVQIGDLVELGGKEIGGYSFDSFYWGTKLHLICREEDIALVHEDHDLARTG